MALIRAFGALCRITFAFAKHQNMNASLTINSSLFSFAALENTTCSFKAHPMITFATLNRVEVVLHTSTGAEKYRVEEKDDMVLIYKLQRGIFGFTYFKKLAQARSRENALKIMHILTTGEVLHWEVNPVDYFESMTF